MNFSGQCYCSSIIFKGITNPKKATVCHSMDCQMFSGAPFRAVVLVSAENVEILCSSKIYVKVAASGNYQAQPFCGECGTQLYSSEPNELKVFNVRLGCVNERAELVPKVPIWRESVVPWLCELGAIPSHRQGSGSPISKRAQACTTNAMPSPLVNRTGNGMRIKNVCAFLRDSYKSVALLPVLGLGWPTLTHARGNCYGDCSGNGVAFLIVAPLVYIYFKFWNKRNGGPSFGQCLVYLFLALIISFVSGYIAVQFLQVAAWLRWIIMACTLAGTFAFFIHPRRHVQHR